MGILVCSCLCVCVWLDVCVRVFGLFMLDVVLLGLVAYVCVRVSA